MCGASHHTMTSKTALCSYVQDYKDSQARIEEEAFADFCHTVTKRCVNVARLGQREYVAVVQFVCTISKTYIQTKFESIFPGCDIVVVTKNCGNEEHVDRVVIRW